MNYLDFDRLPPLPDTLDKAHLEIIYLKNELYKARSEFATQVVKREEEKRQLKGNIKAIAEENKNLREMYKKLDAEHKELKAICADLEYAANSK